MNLDQLRFAQSHEWIAPDGTVGISDHAQKEITDVVFVELPSNGKVLAQAQEAGAIESVKAAFPIYAPVAGTVVAVNGEIAANPGVINQSPYEKGWMFKINITDAAQLQNLMTHQQYQDYLQTNPH